jgi:flagellar motor switch/type III secretory pathway protein FliN
MAAAIAFPQPEIAEIPRVGWQEIQELPCWLTAEIPVSGFTVGDLLRLQVGSLVDSKRATRENVAVRANGGFIGWVEFEVVDGRLSVRFTELG